MESMESVICHFIPFHKDTLSIHTINFVYETNRQVYERLKSESVYKMYYVCEGQGCIYTPGRMTPLSAGDVFFTFPASPFAIESKENFTYMYISFVGLRANMILDRLSISNHNFIFHDANEVYDFWKKGISICSDVTDLISESVLLYTFSFLGNRMLEKNNESKQNHNVPLIKKYIDDHFTDHNFSLQTLSDHLSYNKKYTSSVFKKHFGIGIIEYLNTIRIQNACTMIEQGFTSINDIADRCGYSDSQYFSKMFKAKMDMTPSQYIKAIQTKGKAE